MAGRKVMAKKNRVQVGKFENFTLLAIILWPVIGLWYSLARMIAFDVGNQMIYGIDGIDLFSTSQSQLIAYISLRHLHFGISGH